MSSLRTLLIASALLIPIVISLKCYVITPAQALSSSTPVGTESDCAPNIMTCLKTVDNNLRTVSKTCGNVGQNCTNSLFQPNQPAQCYNASTTTSCCCYGDRCNSTSFTSIFVGLLLAILAVTQYSF